MSRSLWPREHGAYAQLGAPLVAALLVRVPSPSAGLLAIAACAAFLANEPLLVVLGHRGARVRADARPRAARRLGVLGAIALAAGITGLALGDATTLAASALAAAPVGVLIVLAWRRAQHSLAGELVAAIALPAASAPVAVASGLAPDRAAMLWLAWAIGFAASVVAVHRVIAARRGRRAVPGTIAALAAILVGCALARPLAPALPLVGLAFALVVSPPPARHLRAIGIALVASSVVAIAIALHVTQ